MGKAVVGAARVAGDGLDGLDYLLHRLWEDYQAMNPQARQIHDLLNARGETVVNDHVAFRTFAHPGIDIPAMAAPFLATGYVAKGSYNFPEKRLDAVHYEHPEPARPKVFISQLRMDGLSQGARSILLGLINQIPSDFTHGPYWMCGGRPWTPEFATYEALERESEYAAWMSAFGFRVNHFTVFANHLHTFSTLGSLNAFLISRGFRLNTMGGEIKGSRAEHLEQSSTLASPVEVDFREGRRAVPGCYYEFAVRYPLPDGRLFQGFNVKSADKIFQSTDRSILR